MTAINSVYYHYCYYYYLQHSQGDPPYSIPAIKSKIKHKIDGDICK